MKRFAAVLLLVGLLASPAHAYKILYAEQWYKLVHRHLDETPDDCLENIYYLERALRSDFANPLNALTKVDNPDQWEHYRALFRMHVNLTLIQQTLTLGGNYDKQNAYFYNYPWKWANLDSLKKAEAVYQTAKGYWAEAQAEAAKANAKPWMFLPDLQFWQDEAFRIKNAELDYGKVIDKQLSRLSLVRKAFEAMTPATY
jgi:hypothetical protein